MAPALALGNAIVIKPASDTPVSGGLLLGRIFGDVTLQMQLSSDEILGPLVGNQKARDEQHALELANDTEFGLSSAVYSGDLDRGLKFARKIRTGMTHVNDLPVDDEAHLPFGGEKNSGLGHRRIFYRAASECAENSETVPVLTTPANSKRPG